jgi:hypothetical protein
VKFLPGIHHANWLWSGDMDGYEPFVSHSRLLDRKTPFPAATVSGWALDSMGFSMLQRNGRWTITPRQYAEAVIRYDREIGRLDWAAPQDRMCEQAVIEGGTWNGQDFAGTRPHIQAEMTRAGRLAPGAVLTYEEIVAEHQRLTVANFLELEGLWEEYRRRGECRRDSPFRPVLQGRPGDVASYLRHARMYEDAGVRLDGYTPVGVGSVCRIQAEPVIRRLAEGLAGLRLRLHWFGLKLTGLPEVWPNIYSSDSQAWGTSARRDPRLPGCTHVRVRGKYVGQPSTCANCPRYARAWADRVIALGAMLDSDGYCRQLELFGPEDWVPALAGAS